MASFLIPILLFITIALANRPHAPALWLLVLGTILTYDDPHLTGLYRILRTVLNRPALQYLGRISYSLYLIHWPLIVALLALLLRWRPQTNYLEAFGFLVVVGVPIIVTGAALLYRWIEAPCQRWGRAPRPQAAASTPLS